MNRLKFLSLLALVCCALGLNPCFAAGRDSDLESEEESRHQRSTPVDPNAPSLASNQENAPRIMRNLLASMRHNLPINRQLDDTHQQQLALQEKSSWDESSSEESDSEEDQKFAAAQQQWERSKLIKAHVAPRRAQIADSDDDTSASDDASTSEEDEYNEAAAAQQQWQRSELMKAHVAARRAQIADSDDNTSPSDDASTSEEDE